MKHRIPNRKLKKWAKGNVIIPSHAKWSMTHKCSECNNYKDDIIEFDVWWTAWGRNCFDFNWRKNEGKMFLCEECESNEWAICYECGALIEGQYYGAELPEGYDEDNLCPECAEKKFPKCDKCWHLCISIHSGLCEECYVKMWNKLICDKCSHHYYYDCKKCRTCGETEIYLEKTTHPCVYQQVEIIA